MLKKSDRIRILKMFYAESKEREKNLILSYYNGKLNCIADLYNKGDEKSCRHFLLSEICTCPANLSVKNSLWQKVSKCSFFELKQELYDLFQKYNNLYVESLNIKINTTLFDFFENVTKLKENNNN